MSPTQDRRPHWEDAYTSKAPDQVSWFQLRPELSLRLISALGLGPDATILDVGGGASTLVDHLLANNNTSLIVLDLAESALAHARSRIGDGADKVRWIAADITAWKADIPTDVWHDRAVLHFLTEQSDQEAYARALRAVVKPDGWAIIAGFAPGGPERCSGLTIVQHDAASLKALLGEGFTLVEEVDDNHQTPSGAQQAFRYHVLRRAGPAAVR